MKKSLIAAVLAGMMVLSASVAFAGPFQYDGAYKFHYRTNPSNGSEMGKFTFLLNAKTEISKGFDFYARFAAQSATSRTSGGLDFNDAAYSGQSMAAIDQFGFILKGGAWTYKIGRQDAFIGATGLLYDNTGYLGKNKMVDGVTISGKSGITNISFVAAQEDNYGKDTDNKFYTLAASYSPAKNWTLGATFAKYDWAAEQTAGTDTNKDLNIWALNTGYDVGKASFFAEYAKSNADTQNKAYDFGVNYTLDKRNSVWAAYYRVETNADMGAGMTTFDENFKGMYYGFDHQINKDTKLSLFYRNAQQIADGNDKIPSFRTTVTVKF